MKKRSVLFSFLTLILLSDLYSQGERKTAETDVDRSLRHLMAVRYPEAPESRESLLEIGKCGFRAGLGIVGSWTSMTLAQQSLAKTLIEPPQLQTFVTIGRFRVHFDTSGTNEPALLNSAGQRIAGTARMYVDSVGYYFNEVWSFEIDSLGYSAPPFRAGEDFYDVYVQNLGNSLYGETVPFPENPISLGELPARYTTYIRIHRDFQPFFSRGIEGLKVTAAHEFHHAVQLGSYGFWDNRDVFFYEITSTWMEDVVYDDANDYYQYIKFSTGNPRGHFDSPHRSLNVANGFLEYSRAIWGKFIEKRFSKDVMRRSWEFMRRERSLQAINNALMERHSGLREAYEEFSVWNYFTGNRADSVAFYQEARNYPEIRLRDSLQFQEPVSAFMDNVGTESLGSVYFRVFFNARRTLRGAAIVSKTDMASAGNGQLEAFQYVIANAQSDDSYSRINVGSNSFWAKLTRVAVPSDWGVVHSTDSSVLPTSTSDHKVYPNPLYIPGQHWVRFELPEVTDSAASLYIFSSNLELVHARILQPEGNAIRPSYFTWDGRDGSQRFVASGIYVYVLDVNGRRYSGKLTVLKK
jgi:hypothetical protein